MIRKLRSLIYLLLLTVFIAAPLAAQDPFRQTAKQAAAPLYQGKVPAFLLNWSHTLQDLVSGFALDAERTGNARAMLLAFLAAVVFGMIHVAGPGHGKMFTIAYLGSHKARPLEGIVLSAFINIIDTVSAGILVFLGAGLLSVVFSDFQNRLTLYLQIVSYSCIILYGLLEGIHILRNRMRSDHSSAHVHSTEPSGNRSPWLLALLVGMVPCPVSTMILIFGYSHGIVPFAIFLVLGVSIGGFITLSVMTLTLIYGKHRLGSVLASKRGGVVIDIFEGGFVVLIVLTGVLMLLSAII